MSFAIRTAWPDDLDRMVALAVDCQADPQRHCAYLSDSAAAISAEVIEVIDWVQATLVALDDERQLIGWLLATTDPDMDRVWWWGPFVAGVRDDMRATVADALLSKGLLGHAEHSEHEMAADEDSSHFASIADRHGFVAQEGSLALRLDDLQQRFDVVGHLAPVDDPQVDSAAVAALHDATFPGTHSTGAMLLRDVDADHAIHVALDADEVVGYVATEAQSDGSLYVDYLGVAEAHRGRGIGRNLVRHALNTAPTDRTYAHLTVRVGNTAARALYRSSGFAEVRTIVPYRKGFLLD